MVDKTKALKLETPTDGTEFDMIPTEMDPAEDYVSAKGLALENDDATRVEKVAGEVAFIDATNGTKKVSDLLDADQEDFDPTGTDLVSVKTGPAVRELSNSVATSASPGFSFGKGGNVTSGSFLTNEGVPSNVSGRYVYISDAIITRIFVSVENAATFDVEVYSHDGDSVNIALLGSISIVAATGGDEIVSIAVATGKQLALKVNNGSAKNIVCGLELQGTN